jgi:peptide deformylase
MASARLAGAVLPVVQHPATILRAVCAPIPTGSPALAPLLADLAASAAAHGGLGLAAPQVGFALRAIALLLPSAWTEEGLQAAHRPRPRRRAAATAAAPAYLTCVNPRILHASAASRVGLEGCLSLPNTPTLVRRACAVTVEYLDAHGERAVLELSGLPAVVLQHELDHLEGVLLIDKAEALPPGREEEHLYAAGRAFNREVAAFYPQPLF